MQRARTTQAKDIRRQALLDAALDEFYERGFTAARMDDIARRADLSKGAIYLYFESKEDLFKSLIETFAVPNVEKLEAVAQSAGGALAALGAVMKLAPALVRESPVPKIIKVLIADAPAFPEIVAGYRVNVVERVLANVAAILKKAADAGEIDIDDPDLTARLVVAPVILSAIWRIAFEQDPAATVDLEKLFALHEKMLRRALAAGDPS